jgi:hypothetical protein
MGGPVTLTDPALYRNEEPREAANQSEASVPKASPGKGRKPRPS